MTEEYECQVNKRDDVQYLHCDYHAASDKSAALTGWLAEVKPMMEQHGLYSCSITVNGDSDCVRSLFSKETSRQCYVGVC